MNAYIKELVHLQNSVCLFFIAAMHFWTMHGYGFGILSFLFRKWVGSPKGLQIFIRGCLKIDFENGLCNIYIYLTLLLKPIASAKVLYFVNSSRRK